MSTTETTGTTGRTEAAAAPGGLGAPDAPRLTVAPAEAKAPREGITAAWTPLQHPLFRALWIAAAVSNIGTWMQNVGAAWLMTSLAPVPTMVALVQASTALPMLIFGLPAGALADVIDRRRLLLFTQSWMLVIGVLLATVTGLGAIGPWLLLGLTFAIGLGNAATAPAWQAIMPELVPGPEMPKAVALNSATYNIARAVGPALAGLIIAATGPAAVFLLNALSVVGVLVVLFWWQPQSRESELPPETVDEAMLGGLRYALHAPALQAALARVGIFMLCGIAPVALLPLLAREGLGLGPFGFGALVGCFGGGAVLSTAVLPRVRARVPVEWLSTIATLVFAAMTFLLAHVAVVPLLCLVLAVAGACWLTLTSSFNVAAQKAASRWVRGRALAIYLLAFFGGNAAGSALWGEVARHVGIPTALDFAALGLILGLSAATRFRLTPAEQLDQRPVQEDIRLSPAPALQPQVAADPLPGLGPVLVQIEYRIDPGQVGGFARAMAEIREQRCRNGATQWGLFADPGVLGRYLEYFVVDSWAQYLRLQERVTVSDRRAEQRALAFHCGDGPPVVTHYVAEPLPD